MSKKRTIADDAREMAIKEKCGEAAWKLADQFLRHLVYQGGTQIFNDALRDLTERLRNDLLSYPPPQDLGL